MKTQGEAPPTIQDQLEEASSIVPASAGDAAARPTDPGGLLLGLEADGRFHRDRGLGRIYHLQGVSFRESQPANSLHIIVHGNRLAAHVDRVSPLGIREEREARYSLRRARHTTCAGWRRASSGCCVVARVTTGAS